MITVSLSEFFFIGVTPFRTPHFFFFFGKVRTAYRNKIATSETIQSIFEINIVPLAYTRTGLQSKIISRAIGLDKSLFPFFAFFAPAVFTAQDTVVFLFIKMFEDIIEVNLAGAGFFSSRIVTDMKSADPTPAAINVRNQIDRPAAFWSKTAQGDYADSAVPERWSAPLFDILQHNTSDSQ